MKIRGNSKIRKFSFAAILFSFFLLFTFSFMNGNGNGNTPPEGEKNDNHSAATEEHHEEEGEDIPNVIIHHVADSHDWHFTDLPAGTDEHGKQKYTPLAIYLPWILYNSEGGLEFYSSTEKLLQNPHYIIAHEHVMYVKNNVPVDMNPEEAAKDSKYVVVEHGKHKLVYETDPAVSVMDFSITKTVLQIMIIMVLLFLVFTSVARAYKRNEGKAPKGMQSLFEPIIVFVRDDIAKAYIPRNAERYVPYFLTIFFFIWFANLMGLTPLNSNIAGNTSVTLTLAGLTFFAILISSTKDFWMHVLWFPGVPIWLKPLMLVVELVGVISKPAALAIRLFANISAGHFMVLALVCLIFIMKTPGIAPMSIAFGLFILSLEMLVALVQAYVFTLLSAVFIGQAMEKHEHHDEHHAAEAHH